MAGASPKAERDDLILSVRGLSIDVDQGGGSTRLVDNVSFDVHRNEVVGIVGESGSGKSLTMLAVLGLLSPPLRIAAGSIVLKGREITTLNFEEMRAIRGKSMSIVFQDPMTSLNPVLRIGTQIGEAVRLHNPHMSKADIEARVIELLAMVGIPRPETQHRRFPNEFSGGMRQRVMIAIAMANEPDLLIADEPTTALDVTIQAQVMQVLAEVRQRTGAAMVLITHDLGLVAERADRVGVMYSGQIVELAETEPLFARPSHPYTAGLISSLPRIDHRVPQLYSIPGFVPDPAKIPPGCAFHPRCAVSAGRSACRTISPSLQELSATHLAACHFAEDSSAWRERQITTAEAVSEKPSIQAAIATETILKVDALSKEFKIGGSLLRRGERLRALHDVSFELKRGRTLGLVGESGCGKSTLARVLLRLLEASGGRVFLNGEPFSELSGSKLRKRRKDLQVVFQDPYSSLDPRMTVHDVIAEPLRINKQYDPRRVDDLLAHVGLSPEVGSRRSPEFSGGQRQRIAIARALALKPDVLILDEAVSALDVSIQAQIINLLESLQKEFGLTYVFISHDLSVVRHIADEVAVMYLGRFIEYGPTEQIFNSPAHPYTQALLSAIPHMRRESQRIILSGDLPNPMAPPSGCAFRTRCFRAQSECAAAEPPLLARTGDQHMSACYFPGASEVAASAAQTESRAPQSP